MQALDQNLLHKIMEIAQQMTEVGSEISRVEESVTRICCAYGTARVDVYATTSNIIVSVEDSDGVVLTQTRRIGVIGTDMERLHRYNDLVRWMCATAPEISAIDERLETVQNAKRYPAWMSILFSAVIGASFCVFFGGRHVPEIALAFVIGLMIGGLSVFLGRGKVNPLLIRFFCAFSASAVAVMAVKTGLILKPDYILIGNIMILIPGIGITNALRDLFSGDVMTGILRTIEAVLITLSIALGIILPTLIGGMP